MEWIAGIGEVCQDLVCPAKIGGGKRFFRNNSNNDKEKEIPASFGKQIDGNFFHDTNDIGNGKAHGAVWMNSDNFIIIDIRNNFKIEYSVFPTGCSLTDSAFNTFTRISPENPTFRSTSASHPSGKNRDPI
ncbi:MAG TPA: hypothetical protein P5217_08875 [Methanoregulaceae archaeon]|nr:hypothetical protein [Methanoregulaceae archaeon]HPD75860.1 hypothetical protein [Methanoregulaceae archaeon]HRY76383.1 hypothetical protein [Methanoregulaceae archaeon]